MGKYTPRPKRKEPAIPEEIRPIFFAVVATFVWFSILSPLLASGCGGQLSSTVLQAGKAEARTCTKSRVSLRDVWSCPAVVTWSDGRREPRELMSPQDVSGRTVDVVLRGLRSTKGATSAIDYASGSTRVVTTDFPAGSFMSVAHLTLLNLAATVLIWGGAFAGVLWQNR